jgi:hypothetical protein
MAEPTRPDPETVERDVADGRDARINRRRDRIVNEIQRNRRGDYRIPTWVLATALAALVAGWILLIVVS